MRTAVLWQIDGCHAPRRRSPVGLRHWRGPATRRQGRRRVFSPPRSQPELCWFVVLLAFFNMFYLYLRTGPFFLNTDILRSVVTDMVAEKNLRGVLRSQVDRSLSKDSIVIVDSLNNIKVLYLSLSLTHTRARTHMMYNFCLVYAGI